MAAENEVVMRLGAEETAALKATWGGIEGALGGILQGSTAWLARLGAIGAVAAGLGMAIKVTSAEYMAFNESVRQLNQSLDVTLRVNGLLRDQAAGIKAVFQDQARALSSLSVADDNQIMALQRMALNYGIMTGKVNETIEAALNFSAATGMDASTAMQRLAQASNGVYMGWKKWGITIDETNGPLANFDALLAQINTRFGGSARAEIDSYTGTLKEMEKAYQDMLSHSEFSKRNAEFVDMLRRARTAFYQWMTPDKAPPTGPELFERDQAMAKMNAEQEAARKKEDADRAAATRTKEQHDRSLWLAEMAKGWAKAEQDNLEKTIQLSKTLAEVEKSRTAEAERRFSTLAREYATLSAVERERAKRIYEKVEAGGADAWQNQLTRGQREWYMKTNIGQEQLGRQRIFEQQAEKDAGWLRGAGASSKMQVDAQIREELIVRIDPSDPNLANLMAAKTVEEIKAWLADRQGKIKDAIRENQESANAYEVSAAATGGGK